VPLLTHGICPKCVLTVENELKNLRWRGRTAYELFPMGALLFHGLAPWGSLWPGMRGMAGNDITVP